MAFDLNVNSLSFSYKNGCVLDDLNLSIKSGEMIGLLGPNGSGKTTLIKLLAGVLQPTAGEIRLNGKAVNGQKRNLIAQQIAVVPQEFHIAFGFTAGEVVMLGRTPFFNRWGLEKTNDREIVSRVIRETGIQDLTHRYFNELSGGEKQKIILAMSLAQQPELLLLDEPTLHLDINHQVEILNKVKKLNRAGLTVLSAIHDLNLASLFFDRLVMLKKGKIRIEGSPAEVLTEEIIQDVFSMPVRVEMSTETGRPRVFVYPAAVE